ncbi:hypothetical protein RHGRI_007298 [Rhododendron griersonianum]|uniref:Ribosomal protein S12 n=1 Tax=Rhododendron griersonianum TaxID=479676 RepID=A0AAV6KX65_9ERIC|nr:hypothetical protein RHGRI_007297 [Rhododendron griersonianum]KAG5556996.1 hypothetical protein RHGRI_007298 [Rhododendron griersonianum]
MGLKQSPDQLEILIQKAGQQQRPRGVLRVRVACVDGNGYFTAAVLAHGDDQRGGLLLIVY